MKKILRTLVLLSTLIVASCAKDAPSSTDVALAKGLNVDKPRNLAKSVTVE